MRKVINIDIPTPCHENWNSMTPNEKGRHCIACQKTVFDFTKKSDEYIVKTFTENTNICGRFKSIQLKRDLVFSRKDKNNYMSLVASGLFAFLGLSSQLAFSQGEPKTVQVDSSQRQNIKGKVYSKKNTNLVHGVIMDKYNIPLPGANIIIKNTLEGAVSDFDGEFSINAKEGDVLIVSYLGYKSENIKISKDLKKVILLELEEDVTGELSVTVGGAISCTTIYQLTPEEELERKEKREFARKNGSLFYKRKHKEHRQKIKNGMIERSGTGKFLYKITNIFRKQN